MMADEAAEMIYNSRNYCAFIGVRDLPGLSPEIYNSRNYCAFIGVCCFHVVGAISTIVEIIVPL